MIRVLTYSWSWFFLGIIVVATGGYFFATAHAAKPLEIDGTIASYKSYESIQNNSNSYVRNDLQIEGSTSVYMLNKKLFHPILPDEIFLHGKITIWIDKGTPNVIAMTLYDENNVNPSTYTTDLYDHPTIEQSKTQRIGGIIAGVGILIILLSLIWSLLVKSRKRSMQTIKLPAIVTSTELSSNYMQSEE